MRHGQYRYIVGTLALITTAVGLVACSKQSANQQISRSVTVKRLRPPLIRRWRINPKHRTGFQNNC